LATWCRNGDVLSSIGLVALYVAADAMALLAG
jgi:hypothetical protein